MFVSFSTNAANTAQFSAAAGYMPVRMPDDMSPVISRTPVIQVVLDQLKVTKSQDYAQAQVLTPGSEPQQQCGSTQRRGAPG